MVKGIINSFETFGLVDGPSVRFVVFLQGCDMRCKYCHNPETWSLDGVYMDANQVFERAIRYKNYWGEKGGITVSGGEPLLQLDFIIELFELCKAQGINTAIDTSGQPFSTDSTFLERFTKLAELTDLFILDIKAYDSQLHKYITGYDNQNIFDMARWLSDNGKSMWIRHVLVPTITDNQEHLYALKAFIDSLKTVERVEVLPYHTLGVHKWEKLKIPYSLGYIMPPTQQEINKAKAILE